MADVVNFFERWGVPLQGGNRWDQEVYPVDRNRLVRDLPNLRYGKRGAARNNLPFDWVVKTIDHPRNEPEPLEIEITRKLSFSDKIVQFYDYFKLPESDQGYLILEYCNGGTLANWLEENNVQEHVAEFKQIMLDVICALQTLHTLGYVHTDLRADTIGIRRQIGGLPRACLVDLSLIQETQDQCDLEQIDIAKLTRLMSVAWFGPAMGHNLSRPIPVTTEWPELQSVLSYLSQRGEDFEPSLVEVLGRLKVPSVQTVIEGVLLPELDKLVGDLASPETLQEFKLALLQVLNTPQGKLFEPTLADFFDSRYLKQPSTNRVEKHSPRKCRANGILGHKTFGYLLQTDELRQCQLYIGEINSDFEPHGLGICLYQKPKSFGHRFNNQKFQAYIGGFDSGQISSANSFLLSTFICVGKEGYVRCSTKPNGYGNDFIVEGLVDSNLPQFKGYSVNNRVKCRALQEDLFSGQVHENLKQGDGVLEYAPNRSQTVCYSGQWEEDQHHGHGWLVTKNQELRGRFEFGEFIGLSDEGSGSVFTKKDSGHSDSPSLRRGSFTRVGQDIHQVSGIFETALFRYEGTFKNNQFEGRGLLADKVTGQTYDGMFENGLKHGHGRMITERTSVVAFWFGGDLVPQLPVTISNPVWEAQLERMREFEGSSVRMGVVTSRQRIADGNGLQLSRYQGCFGADLKSCLRGTWTFEDLAENKEASFEGFSEITLDFADSRPLYLEDFSGYGVLSIGPQHRSIGRIRCGQLWDEILTQGEFMDRQREESLPEMVSVHYTHQNSIFTKVSLGSFHRDRLTLGYQLYRDCTFPEERLIRLEHRSDQSKMMYIFNLQQTEVPVRIFPDPPLTESGFVDGPLVDVQLCSEESTFQGAHQNGFQVGYGRKTKGHLVLEGHFQDYQLENTVPHNATLSYSSESWMLSSGEVSIKDLPAKMHDTLYGIRYVGEFEKHRNFYRFLCGTLEMSDLDFPGAKRGQTVFVQAKRAIYRQPHEELDRDFCFKSGDTLDVEDASVSYTTVEGNVVHFTGKLTVYTESTQGTDGSVPSIKIIGVGKLYRLKPDSDARVLQFEGEFKNGDLISKGRYYFSPEELSPLRADWKYYVGEYLHSKPHGKGKVYRETNGVIQRMGTQTFKNGFISDSSPEQTQ